MVSNVQGTIYILHFEKPFKHARHYIGWAKDVKKRLKEHTNGNRKSCVLTHELKKAGIGFVVAQLIPGTRNDERTLKNRKNTPRLCPICNGTYKENSLLLELISPPEKKTNLRVEKL